MSTIRVVLADDHAVMRSGLRALLEASDDIEVVGEADDGLVCVERVLATNPDVALVDINMPECTGLEALDTLTEKAPETRVLILTMHDDVEYLHQVLALGGAGYVLKQAAADELITAIHTVHQGGVFLHPEHAAALAGVPSTDTASEPASDAERRYSNLSEREAEVFRLVALGYRNAEIAEMAHISVKTVETYKTRLMDKLGIHSRAGLVRLAIDLDLLT